MPNFGGEAKVFYDIFLELLGLQFQCYPTVAQYDQDSYSGVSVVLEHSKNVMLSSRYKNANQNLPNDNITYVVRWNKSCPLFRPS